MIPFRTILVFSLTMIITCSCTSEEKERANAPALPGDRIEIRGAWARPANPGMMGGAYLTVANGTKQADTLIGITTDIADTAEIHESYSRYDGISGMRPAGPLPIKAGSVLEMKPGAFHIMLMEVNKTLAAGDSISATLHFSRSGSLNVQIPIRQKQ
ncbi:copper chaperone PCu(A)C [Halalkalibaculum sp. DA3122]|uniref:copper chaperone PCu(A)C n=1 Tax=unclassified Halalkalibaculum TaxID=2964617 RepID=UPI0037540F3C